MEPNNSETTYSLGRISTNDLYRMDEKVHTSSTKGWYQRMRQVIAWPLLALYFTLPWISYNENPVVLFDLTQLRFHIFNITLWPQELYILSFILLIAAFGLFALTSWSGRVWCGFSCPQTVWTSIFISIERWLEGSRNSRIKRDNENLDSNIFLLKLIKHSLWLIISFITGYTFVAYFTPVRELISLDKLLDLEGFWVVFFTLATYINAGYMREQVCKYMCPYSRFQSVMVNSDTRIVTYDQPRGEPRKSQLSQETKGDCISCAQCVHVCPVGIDIRQGIQMDCINCGLCIDACDDVMQQVGKATKLIKFETENKSLGKQQDGRNLQLVGYLSIFLMLTASLTFLLITRIPLEIDIVRERGRLYHSNDAGDIENIYRLKIMNRDQNKHDYDLTIEGLDDASLQGPTQISVDAGETYEIALRLSAPSETLTNSSIPIQFKIISQTDQSLYANSESRFLSPDS